MERLPHEFPDLSQSVIADVVRSAGGHLDTARELLHAVASPTDQQQQQPQNQPRDEESLREELIQEVEGHFPSLKRAMIRDILAKHGWDKDAALVPLFEMHQTIEQQRLQRERAEQQRLANQQRRDEREKARLEAQKFFQDVFRSIPPEQIQQSVERFEGDAGAIYDHLQQLVGEVEQRSRQTTAPASSSASTSAAPSAPSAASSAAASSSSAAAAATARVSSSAAANEEEAMRKLEQQRKIKIDTIKQRIGQFVSEAEIRSELLQANWDTAVVFGKLLDIYETRACQKFQSLYPNLTPDEIEDIVEDSQWNLETANRRLNERHKAALKRENKRETGRQPSQPRGGNRQKNRRFDSRAKKMMEKQIDDDIFRESILASENPREIIEGQIAAQLRGGDVPKLDEASINRMASAQTPVSPPPPPRPSARNAPKTTATTTTTTTATTTAATGATKGASFPPMPVTSTTPPKQTAAASSTATVPTTTTATTKTAATATATNGKGPATVTYAAVAAGSGASSSPAATAVAPAAAIAPAVANTNTAAAPAPAPAPAQSAATVLPMPPPMNATTDNNPAAAKQTDVSSSVAPMPVLSSPKASAPATVAPAAEPPSSADSDEEDEDAVLLPVEETFDVVVSLSATRYDCGAPMTVAWATMEPVTKYDWIGVFPLGESQVTYWSWIGNPELVGSVSFAAPSVPGTYEVRYFSTKAHILRGRSLAFVVGPLFTLKAEPIDKNNIAVYFSQSFGVDCPNAWIGVFRRQSDTKHLTYQWCSKAEARDAAVPAIRSGKIVFPVMGAGYWHFRLYSSKQTEVARATCLIEGEDSLSMSVVDGQMIVQCKIETVDPQTDTCWIGIYNASQNNYRQWLRGKSVTARGQSEVAFKLPGAGQYVARLICNGSYDSPLCRSNALDIA